MKRKRSHSTSFLIKRCLILITNFIKFGKCEKVAVFLLHFVCQTLYPYCPNKFFFRLLMLWSLFILFHFFPHITKKSNFILFIVVFFRSYTDSVMNYQSMGPSASSFAQFYHQAAAASAASAGGVGMSGDSSLGKANFFIVFFLLADIEMLQSL